MLEMEKLLAAAQAELVNKERRLESVESELVLEKGLRQELLMRKHILIGIVE